MELNFKGAPSWAYVWRMIKKSSIQIKKLEDVVDVMND